MKYRDSRSPRQGPAESSVLEKRRDPTDGQSGPSPGPASAAGPLTPLPGVEGLPQALAVESLAEYFPGWRLALFDTRGKSIDQIVRRELRWYGALFLGIALLIVSGIVMTLRAATHEAETVRLRARGIDDHPGLHLE